MSRFAGALLLMLLPLSAVQAQSTPVSEAPAEQSNADASPPSAQASDSTTIRSVSELLARMAAHRRELNYQGTFTHQDTNGTDTFRLQHWVDDGTEYQRLYYLQGPEREAVLSKPLGCKATGELLIADRVEKLAGRYPELEKLYSFRVMGLERIAGRPATMLHIVPRDPFRFGYLFSIDRETGLVLKSILLDENQRPVEQFQFVELNTGLEASHFSNAREAQISHRVSAADVSGCHQGTGDEPSVWQLAWVPEGFAFSGQRQVRDDMQMLMYTDGLSTFSVFLDPVASELAIEARAQRGATNFYLGGVKLGSQLYQLTVVGEIPAAVAERVGQSLKPRQLTDAAGG